MDEQPDTPHVIVATLADGTQRTLPCPCEWCGMWAAARPMLNAYRRHVRDLAEGRCVPALGVHRRCTHDGQAV